MSLVDAVGKNAPAGLATRLTGKSRDTAPDGDHKGRQHR